MRTDERDRRDLARRREVLALPMVPLRRAEKRRAGPETWPALETWATEPDAVGTGPGGEVVEVVGSRERADRVLVHRPGGEAPAVVLEGALVPHLVQPLPGGRVVLVRARARAEEHNAQVWDASGRLEASAFVGDAVEHVLTTPSGAIWVGYFDEARDDLGMRKLVRFDDALHPRWRYPYPSERPELPEVFDVLALNVSGERALCYAWRPCHLVEVDGEVVTDLGPTGVLGASAVVVDGDRGVLVGGFGSAHDVVTPFRLTPGGVEVGAPVGRLVLPDGGDHLRLRLRFTARGPVLHAAGVHGLRYRATVADLLDGPRY